MGLDLERLKFLRYVMSNNPEIDIQDVTLIGHSAPFLFLYKGFPTFHKHYVAELLEDHDVSIEEYLEFYRNNSELFGLRFKDETDALFTFEKVDRSFEPFDMKDVLSNKILRNALTELLEKFKGMDLMPVNLDIRGAVLFDGKDVISADVMALRKNNNKRFNNLIEYMLFTLVEYLPNGDIEVYFLKELPLINQNLNINFILADFKEEKDESFTQNISIVSCLS